MPDATQTLPDPGSSLVQTYDAIIVGAGFGGLYMLHRAREKGLNALVVEASDGVGGTWYHNRYPGARVDIQSLEYSFGFDDALQQDWHWTERYAGQPELLRYCLLYTSPSPRDRTRSRMPSSA